MRGSRFDSQRTATITLLIINAVIFGVQKVLEHYRVFPVEGYFALSYEGLRSGFVWQLLTFQFLHANLLHLLLNCWGLYVFGTAVEESLGRGRYLRLYFLSGVMGGLVQVGLGWAFRATFGGPVVGASAGIFGLIAAFAALFPDRQLTLLLFFILPINLRAKYLLLFLGLIALLGVVAPGDNVANGAHLGGMITGLIYVKYFVNGDGWRFSWATFRPAARRPRELVSTAAPKGSIWSRPKASVAEELPPAEFISREVDPILDKISAHGIHSLTARERQILEAARAKMAKKIR